MIRTGGAGPRWCLDPKCSRSANSSFSLTLPNLGRLKIVLGIRLLDKLVTPASDPAEAVPQEVDPKLSVHYQKALESASEGLHAQALEELKESLRENGAFAEAYHELCKAYRNLGDLNIAITALQSAIRIRPQRVVTYTALGVAHDSSRKFS